MECTKCKKSAEHKLVDKWYCARCFSDLVEQKIKHNLRKYNIRKDSRLLVADKASEYIIRKVINLPVKIVKRGKSDHNILPLTLDDQNESLLKRFFENKMQKDDRKAVKLFEPLSKDELEQYFSVKNIKYNPKKTEINRIMDSFEQQYAGTKASLLSSEEKLRKIEAK